MALVIRLLAILAGAGGAWILAQRLGRGETDIVDPTVEYPEENASAWRISEMETHLKWEYEAESAVIYAGLTRDTINRETALATIVNAQEATVTV
ncbi:MAG: hypothetical protein ACPG7F_21600, partial [Aggregatilineales bacterium]